MTMTTVSYDYVEIKLWNEILECFKRYYEITLNVGFQRWS